MKVYKIQEDYIKYLRTKEPRVLENKEQKRPYVGVVLEINGFSYYVPLMDERKGVYFDIDYMTDEQVAVISQLIDIFRTTNMGGWKYALVE